MYNAFLATHPRARRKQTEDSPATAGLAKTPTATGSASRAELEAMAARHGWQPRELTMQDIREMSSAELRYHEVCNKENYEKALTIEENKRTNKRNMAGWNVKRMWSGQATEEEDAEARIAGDAFASRYAQFIRNLPNAEKIVAYMEDHNLDATQVESYVAAFEALTMEGKLVLSPKAAGIGTEDELTGDALRTYSRLHMLVQPHRTLKPEDKLSADEWFAQHPELHDTRMPPLVAARNQRDQNTAAHFAKASSASSGGHVVNVVDYGEQPRGVPPQPDKVSFRKKIQSMTADEIRHECEIDPSFRAALDALK